MTPAQVRELGDEWGAAGREYLSRRTQAGSPEGEAYTVWLTALPPAEAGAELMPLFALSETRDLAGDIAGDLGIDPGKAELIAEEIAASRRRIARATRPFRRRGEPADNEAG